MRRALMAFTQLSLLLIASPAALSGSEAVAPYGLYETYVDVEPAPEDPYDSRSLAVDAAVTLPGGEEARLPLFFDGEKGWGLRFTSSLPGPHRVRIEARRKGGEPSLVRELTFQVEGAPASRGFVRPSDRSPRLFAFDDGTSFFPLGENVGWLPSIRQWDSTLGKLGKAGANWIRIWMCSWGPLALEWTRRSNPSIYHDLDAYSLENARRLDDILRLATENGIYVQVVFNNHGQFSSRTNPEWNRNPYNVANGGFLGSPEEFFTNDEAKRRYRDRLRYLVARYGWSPHIFAWELWNEVNLTDRYDPEVVGAWHGEMSRILKALDPFDHPVTTSGSGSHLSHHAFEGMDFLQTHEYRPDVVEVILSREARARKEHPSLPHFLGELGTDWRGPPRGDRLGVGLHDMLWASIHGGASGTAMTWWWDNWVEPNDLYDRFRCAAAYVREIPWVSEGFGKLEAAVEPRPGNVGSIVVNGQSDWRRARVDRFRVSADGSVSDVDECPLFLQGKAHPDLRTNPTFEVDLEASGAFEIAIETIAKAGGALAITVDGEEALRREFASGERDYAPPERDLRVPLSPGRHEVRLSNDGPDWIRFGRYRIEGAGSRLLLAGLRGRTVALLWVKDRSFRWEAQDAYAESPDVEATVIELRGLEDGVHALERWDPWKGAIVERGEIRAAGGEAQLPLPAFRRDVAFRLLRRQP